MRSNARKANPILEEKEGMDPIKFSIRSGKQADARLRLCLCISIFVGIALFCYALLFVNGYLGTRRYAVVIDGGSTGTRIHVFTYVIRGGNLVPDFSNKGLVSMKVSTGLSAYAQEPRMAGHAVAELMEFAKRNVPRENWGQTQVRLMATAGMRLLEIEDKERVLNACRQSLRASGFQFRDDWVSVISGSDEGLYAWVVANYALGTLGAYPSQTTGIIELGGASAQVTFVSNETLPAEFSKTVKFGNFTYNLYSHSWLNLGQNAAFHLLKESLVPEDQKLVSDSNSRLMDPCTPRGYTPDEEAMKLLPVTGNELYPPVLLPCGNFSECRSACLELLQRGRDKCTYSTCHIGSAFTPKLQGKKFLLTENFFHTSKFFGLGPKAFLPHLVASGQQFCGEDWSKLTQKRPSLHENNLLHYCFSSAYIVAFLHDGLGIPLDDQRIQVANQVHSIPLDWALGAFILQTTTELDVSKSIWELIWSKSPQWLLVGGVFIAFWLTSTWKKPQLKTIYDVENGRYMVRRASRLYRMRFLKLLRKNP